LRGLPSPRSPTGFLDKCTACIRAAAATSRIEREQRASAAKASKCRSLTASPVVRPLRARIEPRLFNAASRFVRERQSGEPSAIDAAIEPELMELLLWLHDQTLKEVAAPRTPEEIGREILGYREDRVARGIAFGALWASLVRLAAVYAQQDARVREKLEDGRSSPRLPKRAGRKVIADALKPVMIEAIEPAKGQTLELAKAYSAYEVACRKSDRAALPPDQFAHALAGFCKGAGIPTQYDNGKLYLLNVQIKGAQLPAQ
jgi:hypothetical protein